MYRLCSKLVCLFVQASVCVSKPEDASLLQNLSISLKLQIQNALEAVI